MSRSQATTARPKHAVTGIAWSNPGSSSWDGVMLDLDGEIVGELVPDKRFSNVLRIKLDGFGMSRTAAVVVQRTRNRLLTIVPLAEAVRRGKPR